MTHPDAGQLGFDSLLRSADEDNRARKLERETSHLPGTMDEAIPFYRALLGEHHAAMLDADVEQSMRLRGEAHMLALKLNDGEPGILADDDAPGCVLARETVAATDTVPLWGQTGEFVIDACGMRVRIELDGIFGIAGDLLYWPAFAARAVDLRKPFLSETGYRSFFGINADPQSGLLPDEFAARAIEAYVAQQCKGRLVAIEPRYVQKHQG